MIIDSDSVINEIKNKGAKRAETKAYLVAAIESRKVVLAEQMNKLEQEAYKTPFKYDIKGKPLTEAKLDRLARVTQEYKNHINKIKEYTQACLDAESDYEAILANKSFLRDMNSESTAKISQGIYKEGE